MEVKSKTSNVVATKPQQTTITQIINSVATQKLFDSMHLSQQAKSSLTASMIKYADDPKLRNCDKYSIFKYCLAVYSLKLEGIDKVYPVPYGVKDGRYYVQMQVGYKGFREMAMRSGKYASINCSTVCECDKVLRNPETGRIEVEFETDYTKAENAKVIGFFAYALDKNTHQIIDSEYMSQDKINKHATKYSETYKNNNLKTPWFTEPIEMAKKTVIKKLCKRLDTSEEMQNLVANDQIVFGSENEKNIYADNPNNKETFSDEVIDVEVEETF